jgi:hypothetical protein
MALTAFPEKNHMNKNRDDFSVKVKKTLERRVGARCSAGDCRKPTCGPTLDPEKPTTLVWRLILRLQLREDLATITP